MVDLSDEEYEVYSALTEPTMSELRDNPVLGHHFREAEARGVHIGLQHDEMDDFIVYGINRTELPATRPQYVGRVAPGPPCIAPLASALVAPPLATALTVQSGRRRLE